jgi:hypothetical protein
MKVLVFIFVCTLVAVVVAKPQEVTTVTEKEAAIVPTFNLPSFNFDKDFAASMEHNFNEKMNALNAEETLNALYNMTSLVISPMDQAVTMFSQVIVPYGITFLLALGLYYIITGLIGFVLNTKMTIWGLGSEFLSSNIDVFSGENMAAANDAAERMLTNAVYTAIDRVSQLNLN